MMTPSTSAKPQHHRDFKNSHGCERKLGSLPYFNSVAHPIGAIPTTTLLFSRTKQRTTAQFLAPIYTRTSWHDFCKEVAEGKFRH